MLTDRDQSTRERRLNVAVVVTTLAAIPLVLYLAGALTLGTVEAVVDPEPPSCDGFSFDRSEWDDGPRSDNRGAQAEGLATCEVIEGSTRAEVQTLLGERGRFSRQRAASYLSFEAGEELDVTGYSPDSVRHLVVHLERGRVAAVRLSPDPFAPNPYADPGAID